MSFKPWYERLPDRLKVEVNAYKEAHLNFQLSNALLEKHGMVVFEGEVIAADRKCPLQVVYPSAFPLVRPEVVAASAELKRHQNPYEANLCLLPNDQDAWCETDTGALMVRQAIALLDANHTGTEAVAAREVDAPEPYSTWYPYSLNTAFIILEQPPAMEEAQFGQFEFVVPSSGRAVVQAVLTKMIFASRTKGASVPSDWHLPEAMMPFHTGQKSTGSWMRCNEPPPFCKTAAGERAGFNEYLAWAKSRESHLSSRLADLSKKQDGFQAFALVYPDEGPERGQHYDNWLVGMNGPGLPKPVLLRPFQWTQGDQLRRQPSLSGLANKKVLIVGLGALGASLASHLARAGVGQLGLVDPDFVEAGPLVRQDFDLHDIGLLKTEAVGMRVRRINPRIAVQMFPFQLGAADVGLAALTQATDSLVQFVEAIQGYDLLISTAGTASVDRLLNEIASESARPSLFTWVLNGAWGGRIFRALPQQACYECLTHSWEQFSSPQQDPSETDLYARGCGFPTFTGTGFDAAAVAGLAARFAVQTLLAGKPDGYPDSPFNLINWSSRGSKAGMFPEIENFNVDRQEQCRICQMYNP
jgi:hypothetical protein